MPKKGPSKKPVEKENFTGEIDDNIADIITSGIAAKKPTKADVQKFSDLKRLENDIATEKALVDGWKLQTNNDARLKRFYAKWIMAGLGVEVLMGNIIMFFIGYKKLDISPWVADVFFVGMYTQIITLATLVVKNLFPVYDKDPLTQLNEMLKAQKKEPPTV